jgi:hypothetical protein
MHPSLSRAKKEPFRAGSRAGENAVYTRRLVEPTPGERWLLVTSA